MGLIQKYVDGVKHRKGIPGVISLLNSGFWFVSAEARSVIKNEGKMAIPPLFTVLEDP